MCNCTSEVQSFGPSRNDVGPTDHVHKKIQNRLSDRRPPVRPWVEIRRKGAAMAKLIFVNLPVADLARATVFYQAVGAEKNEQFSDATASCMVFSETIHAMLLTHDKFRQFTPKKIADAKSSSEVLICISADS